MREENHELWAWLRPLPTDDVDMLVRRAALAALAYDLFGRWPLVTDESKLRELLKSRIPEGTPRHCITPNGCRDKHGGFVESGDLPGEWRCAFCKGLI